MPKSRSTPKPQKTPEEVEAKRLRKLATLDQEIQTHRRSKLEELNEYVGDKVSPVGYTLGQILGEGEFGEVREAGRFSTGSTVTVKADKATYLSQCTEVQTGQVYAVKFFGGRRSASADECAILRHLRPQPGAYHSAHIQFSYLDYLEVITDKKIRDRFAVLELAHFNLHELIDADYESLDPGLVKGLAYQLMLGCDFLHQKGVVNRDIKPENILVVGSVAATYRVVIADHGVGYLKGAERESKLVNSGGTRAYTSPEVIEYLLESDSRRPAPLRADDYPVPAHPSRDWWAIGVVIIW